jgi:hypothetical protein
MAREKIEVPALGYTIHINVYNVYDTTIRSEPFVVNSLSKRAHVEI